MRRDTNIVRQRDESDERKQRGRLRAMRAVALGLLGVAALLFALARARHGAHPGWGYLQAFSEAAMVGAIADWFAVTALFRHPLGIPLWHTAIIPNRKEDIGKSLGGFVERHFITEEGIDQHIREADLARKIGEYLLQPAHAETLAKWAAAELDILMRTMDQARCRHAVRAMASAALARVNWSTLAGACVDALIAEDQPQALLDALLERLAAYLADADNHADIERCVHGVAGIDSAMLKSMLGMAMPSLITSITDKVLDVRLDRAHPLRRRIGAWIADSAQHLKADPAWQATIARCQGQMLASEAVQTMLGGLWDALRARLASDLRSEQPTLPVTARGLIEQTGRLLTSNTALRERLNRMLLTWGRTLVREHRGEVGRFIEVQLATWTKDEMSTRIELAIGRDLQFIRINGALVGGLVGLLIHLITVLLPV